MKVLGSTGLLLPLLWLACAGPGLEDTLDLSDIDAAEAQFGEGCRKVPDPQPVLDYLAALPDDWQAFWTEAPAAAFHVSLAAGGRPRLRVGLVGGQMILESAGQELRFRQVTDAQASRLVELVGGVPLGGQLEPCVLAQMELSDS